MSRNKSKLLAECPEFRLVRSPDGVEVVESSEEIEAAMWKAAMRISYAGADHEQRVRLAQALLSLAEFTSGHKVNEKLLLESLATTLGELILAVLNRPSQVVRITSEKKDALKAQFPDRPVSQFANSAKESIKRAEDGADSVGAAVRNAVLALSRWKLDGDDWKRERMMLTVAKEIFRETRVRPTKRQIRICLESEGMGIGGKNANAKWKDAFVSAGLDDLPRC